MQIIQIMQFKQIMKIKTTQIKMEVEHIKLQITLYIVLFCLILYIINLAIKPDNSYSPVRHSSLLRLYQDWRLERVAVYWSIV